ncbi:helix-turn-helix transcriptional regulator [Photobacterium swingsii]|uniref:helix-turn-helix transcriptional regulator n=1 Tax=Photobacterium swingsii TaxID=680026 RepID=UPI0040675E44
MPEKSHQPFILVPEAALLAKLPEHQRTRFEKALSIMHKDIASVMSWEQVAKQSAISPFHFHRQFTHVFHETPGRYLGRIRLQYAVSMLFEYLSDNVTDIALQCGYSSSQALAKALKRDLNMTAKAIRHLGNTGTPEDINALFEKLAHRDGSETPLENQLAEAMPCELKLLPDRALKRQPLPDLHFDDLCEKLGEKMLDITFITQVPELEKSWNEDQHTAGTWVSPQPDVNCEDDTIIRINAGHFLCCDVCLMSDIGYIAAIDGLFYHAEKLGYEIDQDGYCIEQITQLDMQPTGGLVLSLQIAVKVNTPN